MKSGLVCWSVGTTLHCRLHTLRGVLLADSADPHNVAYDQGLQCLLTGFSIKIEQMRQNIPNTPKMTN